MASGNGDNSYMPLKCEYPDEDDDEVPDENDFIAPIEYIDPVSVTMIVLPRTNCVYFFFSQSLSGEIYNRSVLYTSIL